ncbi:MAG TPA: hypothetical protein PK400_05840, partial [Phycisphaerales bacterium]|nr:hypothetical protein [Phycisphaerales bacterium]
SRIARWDGIRWHALGAGVAGEVRGLTSYRGNLIAGGDFGTAGGVSANAIARWDGTQWHAMGSGMSNIVKCLAVYNGELVAGGAFTTAGGQSASYIARWNGTQWAALGTGTNDFVHSLAVYDSNLLVAGEFTSAGGVSTNTIARWNGCAMQQPLRAPIMFDPSATVYHAQPTYRWEHTWTATWYQLWINDANGNILQKWYTAVELGCEDGTCEVSPQTLSLVGQSRWWVRGWNSVEKNGPWSNPMIFTPTCMQQWGPVGAGISGTVYELAVYEGDLIAGGSFTVAGGNAANRIARWDGTQWSAMGAGVNSWVLTFAEYEGDLVAGGLFTTSAGQPVSFVAQWDGAIWQPLSTGMSNIVEDLIVYQGDLIACGQFTTAGGSPAGRIARWDGTQWHQLGNGMNSDVSALAVFNGDLIAGGNFTMATGKSASYIARWDGTRWYPLGSGMNGAVRDLVVYNGQLIAGGVFTTAGGATVNRIARWDGTQWHPMGTGMDAVVNALAIHDGDLIAGGAFTSAGGVGVGAIARWDGSQWHALDTGMDDPIWSLGVYQGNLFAGGLFTSAGSVAANRVAKWNGCWAFERLRAPAQSGPSGLIQHRQPIFRWEHNPNATWYYLWINNASNQPVHKKWYTAVELGCEDGMCEVTPNVTLPRGAGRWWVQPWNEAEKHGPWSSAMLYTIKLETPVQSSPSGNTTDVQPTYEWKATPHATWYQLWVNDVTGTVVNQWYTVDQLTYSAGAFSIPPNVNIALGNATWWVRAWSAPLLHSPWSAPMNFVRQP